MFLTTRQQDRQTDGTDHSCQPTSSNSSAASERLSPRGDSAAEIPHARSIRGAIKKLSPVQMRNRLVEPIDVFPLKQVAQIYHRSGGAWSHLEPVFKTCTLTRTHASVFTWWNRLCVYECVCVSVWMDSLPPRGHHDCSLSVILTGSCSAKWDFPGDYSL